MVIDKPSAKTRPGNDLVSDILLFGGTGMIFLTLLLLFFAAWARSG